MEYKPMVVAVARDFFRRRVANVTLDELVGAGIWGLYKAAVKYTPEAGCDYRAFAKLRVWREIVEWMRKYNPRRRRPPLDHLEDHEEIGDYLDPGTDQVDAADQVRAILRRLEAKGKAKELELLRVMLRDDVGHCTAAAQLGISQPAACHRFERVRALAEVA